MVKVNEDQCVGCGVCANICPEGIEMVDGIAKIKNENADCLKDAASTCPKKCIILDDDKFEDNGSEESNNTSDNNFDQGFGQGQGRGMGGGLRDGSGMGRGIGFGNGRGKGMGRGNGRGRRA